ncbi:UVB-resistance protein UVR8 [Thecamonas trahens ATCC 50062]|uniref:UVB-resistance protein UVR8 n=1 Tax=Thecamonas trahens ATCC 50062 TaxID=461836 RepID=A0A0L0DNM7_THETB|nr:UVB-resistance protein UVR8 [Thecamonas trahens ATCC 50062]KNC53023.1 UVB-resistance protein UVR8 [Thecamonas trahens ATCC 50062]|eukprot:XP_013754909.1 UVB-resistance protein UVR8 [Thecamonas trahens ATCC 50062]
MTDGLYTFGSGECAQLGLGHDRNELLPVHVAHLPHTRLVSISLGDGYGAAVTDDGRLFTWGDGDAGQLGHGGHESVSTPKEVTALAGVTVVAVSMGCEHTLILDADGDVWSCGTGDYGILGHGSENDEFVPRKIAALTGTTVVDVSAGTGHSGAVTADGQLFLWGFGGFGQLGLGTTETILEPTPVPLDGKIAVDVSCGMRCTAVVCSDGSLYTCGDNECGKLGLGDLEPRLVLTRVDRLASVSVTQVSISEGSGAAVTNDGALYSWGHGRMGNLGHGTETNPEPLVPRVRVAGYNYERDWAVPKRVAALANVHVVHVAMGPEHSACLTADGQVYTWGEAANGETGHGDTFDRMEPERLDFFDSLGSAIIVEVGSDHTGVVIDSTAASAPAPVAAPSATSSSPTTPAAPAASPAASDPALAARVTELESALAASVARSDDLAERLAIVEVLLLDALKTQSS